MNNQKSDCLFCKIIKKEIPSTLLLENEKAIAILDAFPMSAGHILVLPKQHAQYFHQMEEEMLQSTTSLLKKLTTVLYQITQQDYNVLNNNGAVAGQSIFHFHWHLLPRLGADNVLQFKHGKRETAPYYKKWQHKLSLALQE